MTALLILVCAAVLEVGGDALMRRGLHAQPGGGKLLLLAAGGAVLFGYGAVVNLPRWDFGRLLGVYVAVFFVAAQVVDLAVFHVQPGRPVLAGGALIVAGGLVMTFWR